MYIHDERVGQSEGIFMMKEYLIVLFTTLTEVMNSLLMKTNCIRLPNCTGVISSSMYIVLAAEVVTSSSTCM